jgi:hypothetical protein
LEQLREITTVAGVNMFSQLSFTTGTVGSANDAAQAIVE